MKDIFKPEVVEELVQRIDKLSAETKPQWGKMNAPQMLAHCNVSYEMVFTDKHPKPNGFVRLMLRVFVKDTVVGEKPYKRNSPTAKQFMVSDQQDFNAEKQRMIDHMNLCVEKGRSWFDGKESNSFGNLTTDQWNTMFYKHIDHHLRQFGA